MARSFMRSLCHWLLLPMLLIIAVISLLPLIPNMPPNYKFTSFTLPDPPVLEGKIALNTLLNNAERIYENEIVGPEAFTVFNGELYTTLHGGFVAKISNQKVVPVVKFGQSCEGRSEEAKCGRPLGLCVGPDDKFYIADAYYGIFTYDAITNEKAKVFGPEAVVGNRKPKLFNSVTVASDGVIFWTDSTSDVTLEDGLFSLLADGTGRLVAYDPETMEHTVLIDGLLFANGVALAVDEAFVLVAETGKARIHRFWLKGNKAGTSDIFIDRLPGLPDNLRTGVDGFLVSLVLASDSSTPILAQALYPFPYIRKAISSAMYLFQATLRTINAIIPNPICKKGAHMTGHFEMTKPFSPLRVTILALNYYGDIRDAFHALDGSVHSISDAMVHRGILYLGSPYNNYLGRIRDPHVVSRFTKAFRTPVRVSVRVTEAGPAKKPDTATQKPTTTSKTQKSATKAKPAAQPSATQKPAPKPTTTTPKTTTKPAPAPKPAPKPAATGKPPKPRSSDEL